MSDSPWKNWFRSWPRDIPYRGVLVVKFGEQIPFDGLLVSDELLLVERRAPDTVGARKVMVPFEEIAAVKFTDVVKSKFFETAGFAGKMKD